MIVVKSLSYCVTRFIVKQPELAKTVLRTLFDFWPSQNSKQAVILLNGIEEIIEVLQPVHVTILISLKFPGTFEFNLNTTEIPPTING